jgi:hypothetical protein
MEEKNMIKFELGLPRGIYFSNIHNSLFTKNKNKNMCVYLYKIVQIADTVTKMKEWKRP